MGGGGQGRVEDLGLPLPRGEVRGERVGRGATGPIVQVPDSRFRRIDLEKHRSKNSVVGTGVSECPVAPAWEFCQCRDAIFPESAPQPLPRALWPWAPWRPTPAR